ncbi:MAG: hypothetical protein AB8B79_08690 [Granulosicoccus sp.]
MNYFRAYIDYAQTRLRMHELLTDFWLRRRKTVLFVTHDVDEARLVAIEDHRYGLVLIGGC